MVYKLKLDFGHEFLNRMYFFILGSNGFLLYPIFQCFYLSYPSKYNYTLALNQSTVIFYIPVKDVSYVQDIYMSLMFKILY